MVTACHVPLSELARLTDRQLIDIYAHERDKDGAIKVPEEGKEIAAPEQTAATLESDLRDLTILAGMLRMSPATYEETAAKIKAKWAAREAEARGG